MKIHNVGPGDVGIFATIEAQEGCEGYPSTFDGTILWVGRQSFVFAQKGERDQILGREEWCVIDA